VPCWLVINKHCADSAAIPFGEFFADNELLMVLWSKIDVYCKNGNGFIYFLLQKKLMIGVLHIITKIFYPVNKKLQRQGKGLLTAFVK
jgi:hypothetical protein